MMSKEYEEELGFRNPTKEEMQKLFKACMMDQMMWGQSIIAINGPKIRYVDPVTKEYWKALEKARQNER